jgi:HEAT repeat protein
MKTSPAFARLFALTLITVASTSLVGIVSAEDQPANQEQQFIAVLQTGEPAAKALACKQLAIHGGKNAVPELAKLLSDEQLASWARIALEAIPDASAGEALRAASENLDGMLLVGTLNSIGVRRDAEAVPTLVKRLSHDNAEVASAAAVALGRIGNPAAVQALRPLLASAPKDVKQAVAEGCVLCAEQLLSTGNEAAAAELYDEIRKADVPKQNKLEATRGAILARKIEGIPLLVEQLRSQDKGFVNIGLSTARELPGQPVAEALAAELDKASAERAALILYALADRQDAVVTPAIVKVATEGEPQVRIAALAVLGRSTDAANLPPLLIAAADANADVAQAAQTALASMKGDSINAEITQRLNDAEGKNLSALIALVGQRRIPATAALEKALQRDDATIRQAALRALGETIAPQEMAVLIKQVVSPKHTDDAGVARKALMAASVRMPDRDACATELATALAQAPAETKVVLVEILGAVQGPKALATIATAMKSGDESMQDASSRLLGQWMTIDAAPVLLDLAKTSSGDKYQVRCLRGFIRIARQFTMPAAQRAEMCRQALETARRPEEQQLVLQILDRYPTAETFKVAVFAASLPGLKDGASATASNIAHKLTGHAAEAEVMLKEAGLEPPQLQIVKAEYGAGGKWTNVTGALRQHLKGSPQIDLPAGYNVVFGGDPTPGVKKQLKVQYRLNGKLGDAAFDENQPIVLPAIP